MHAAISQYTPLGNGSMHGLTMASGSEKIVRMSIDWPCGVQDG